MQRALFALGLMILALPGCATKWKGYSRYTGTGETLEKEIAKAEANPSGVRTVVITESEDTKDPLVCGWEAPLGSNIRERVCREEENLYWKRQGAQTWMDGYLHSLGGKVGN
jgi:hypothetical protein